MKKTSIALAAALTVLLAACGEQESAAPDAPATEAAAPEAAAPEAAAPEAAAPEAAVVADNAQGKSVFNKSCAMCHASGAAGAPMNGDKADWGPRIAQGTEVLYTHAIEGFTGEKGVMPARGGSVSLSDEEVKAAVDYMVAQAQ